MCVRRVPDSGSKGIEASGPSMRNALQECRVRSANTAANASANRQVDLNSAIKPPNSPINAIYRVFASALSRNTASVWD